MRQRERERGGHLVCVVGKVSSFDWPERTQRAREREARGIFVRQVGNITSSRFRFSLDLAANFDSAKKKMFVRVFFLSRC